MAGTWERDSLVFPDHSGHATHHAECLKHLVSFCLHKNPAGRSVVISPKQEESRFREAMELPKITQQTRHGAMPQVLVLDLRAALSGASLCFLKEAFGKLSSKGVSGGRISDSAYREEIQGWEETSKTLKLQ